ncbi:MAG TPA: TIGR00725 family protein [Jatrophihabitans sp.]|jgi:hypothetical protein
MPWPDRPLVPDATLIAVLGPADATDELYDLARAVGRGLARRGFVVVTGGLGGVMEAAARGAAEAGGRAVGVLPGDDPSEANRYVSDVVATGLGEYRNALVVRDAAAIVAVGGSWGTLSEIALAVRARKPVAALRGWNVHDQTGRAVAGVCDFDTPAQAVAWIAQRLDRRA